VLELSIVIPAFRESAKIAADVRAAADFCTANHITAEIIVVDDGSTDHTADAAQEAAASLPDCLRLQVIRLPHHHGKGAAVRTGVLASTGRYVMFADSGCCVPYQDAAAGLEMLRADRCDIAHGSRKLPESIIRRPQPIRRRISATLFRCITRKLLPLDPNLTDTQCGFKLYKGDIARQLYRQSRTDGFMFDLEIILLAREKGYRIKEFPIRWSCDPDSRLSLARDPCSVFLELMKIKRRLAKHNWPPTTKNRRRTANTEL